MPRGSYANESYSGTYSNIGGEAMMEKKEYEI